MKFKLLTATAALLLTQSALAAPLAPAKCPSISSIKSVGVSVAEEFMGQLWIAGELKNRYDTADEWTFLAFVNAESSSDAISKANAAIADMSYAEGPVEDKDDNGKVYWGCSYQTQQGEDGPLGIAITPAVQSGLTKYKRFMHR